MIKIGEYQTLTILREMPQGYYLEDEDENEVLLPRKYITEDMEMDDQLKVFVYCDSSGREVATTEKPLMTVNQFASLTVTHVNDYGAFCDWGINKELFVPFSNQHYKLQAGDKAVVYMYLDEVSERLVGTTRLKSYFQPSNLDLKMGQKVKCLVYGKTDLGYKVIIDQKYDGLIYANEVKSSIRPGDIKIGYLKPIREDGKLDVSLDAVGHQHIEPNSKIIMDKLLAAGGHLPYTDKSEPEVIRQAFGLSKKMFKKALGKLYKERLVQLKPEGIYAVTAPKA